MQLQPHPSAPPTTMSNLHAQPSGCLHQQPQQLLPRPRTTTDLHMVGMSNELAGNGAGPLAHAPYSAFFLLSSCIRFLHRVGGRGSGVSGQGLANVRRSMEGLARPSAKVAMHLKEIAVCL